MSSVSYPQDRRVLQARFERNNCGDSQDRVTPEKRKDFMASQFKLPEELCSTEGINHWAKCYTNDQTIVAHFVEQYLIGLKDTVLARNSHGGYLCKDELYDLAYWKSSKSAHWINGNHESCVKEITAKAFCLDDNWEKLKKLVSGLKGVGEPVGSAILHFYDREKYPILDKRALCSVGINHRKVKYDALFWQEYVDFCREKAKCYGVSMRVLDRALWKLRGRTRR